MFTSRDLTTAEIEMSLAKMEAKASGCSRTDADPAQATGCEQWVTELRTFLAATFTTENTALDWVYQ